MSPVNSSPLIPTVVVKLMVEQLIHDFGTAYGLPSVIFRYFNAAGADPNGDLGENHTPEPHLIPRILDVLAGRSPVVEICGIDYPTPDGTCIRDYIHVSDLADAHVLGLKKLLCEGGQHVFNLGTGTGYSVRQVIDSVQVVTGRGLTVKLYQGALEIRRNWWHLQARHSMSSDGSLATRN